jgi:hypothetical protein
MWTEFFLYSKYSSSYIFSSSNIFKAEGKLYDYLSLISLEQNYKKIFTFLTYFLGFLSLGIKAMSFLWLVVVIFTSVIFPVVDSLRTGFNLY